MAAMFKCKVVSHLLKNNFSKKKPRKNLKLVHKLYEEIKICDNRRFKPKPQSHKSFFK